MEEKILDRVRKLLAQAENTTYPGEAETFTAKAVALMAEHGIEQAHLAAAGRAQDEIGSWRVDISAPYAIDKATLLTSIAQAFRCEVIGHWFGRTMEAATVFGFASDRERVELLYTSLLLQATTQVVRQYPEDPGESVAAYRRSWLTGFAAAVGYRLQLAEQRAATESQAASGGVSTALVLRDRRTAVREAFAELGVPDGPAIRRSGTGYTDGAVAGQRADLGNGRVGGGKAAIGRG